jgi:hypothetical protein
MKMSNLKPQLSFVHDNDVANLYEELVMIGKMYGKLDAESNRKMEARRVEICQLLEEAGE